MKKMETKSQMQKCTHPVPKNSYGIRARHSLDNAPLPPQDCAKLLEGPIAAVQPDLDADCSEPIVELCLKHK